MDGPEHYWVEPKELEPVSVFKKDFAFAPIYTRDEVLQTLKNAMKQSGTYVTIHKKIMDHLIESISKF